MNHNIKIVLGLVVVFLVGAFQAYHSGWNPTDIITMVVSGLLAVEHEMNGNTDSLNLSSVPTPTV